MLFIFFFTPCLYAQISLKSDFVNKRTDQWLSYSYSKGPSSFYDLITKRKNEIEVKQLKIPATQLDSFKASLKSSGFKEGAILLDKSKKFHPSVELESVSLETITGQDTIFKFRYKISLRNKKQKLLGERLITRLGNDKTRVRLTLKDHLYQLNVHNIKGTSIISVQLCSDGLMHPDTKHHTGVFSYCPDFYF